MALVATINGKPVHSDKEVASIINTRVTFFDGSWCDVTTGQVVNRGVGYITIGGSDEDAQETITEGPHTYKAHELEVRHIAAELSVDVHDKPEVEVTIVGPASAVKAIQVRHKGDLVVIESDAASSSENIFIGGSIRVGQSFFMGDFVGGNVVMSSGGGKSLTKVTVKVPLGAGVTLSGMKGNATLGNTEGPLQVHSQAHSNVLAGKVSSASVKLQGSGDVTIAAINGVVNIGIQGSGDVRIIEGKATTLAISIQGSGDAFFDGEATDATLSVMGSGDILVRRVINKPIKRVMGTGNIRVRQVG